MISLLQPPVVSTLQGITINMLLLTIYTLSKHNLYESKNESMYSKRLNYTLSYLLLTISVLTYGITRIILFLITYKPYIPGMNYFEKAYFFSEAVFLLIFAFLFFKIIFQEVFDLKLEKTKNPQIPKEKTEENNQEDQEETEKELDEQVNMVVRKNKDHEIEKLPVIVYVD